jgi:3-dehydroquinate synthase class II
MTQATAPRIPLWVDLRHVPVNKRLPYLKAVRSANAERIVVGNDDAYLERTDVPVVRVDGRLALKAKTKTIGRWVRLRGGKDQERAGRVPGIVVAEATDWQVIPLENLIAARRDRPGTLYAFAQDASQALLFRDTLEVGVHGIVLAPREPADIEEADRVLRARGARPDDRPRAVIPAGAATAGATAATPADRAPRAAEANAASAPASKVPAGAASKAEDKKPGRAHKPVDKQADRGDKQADKADQPAQEDKPPSQSGKDDAFLVAAKITRIEDAGPGDRVCVDTTSLLRPGEGLLVGATSKSFVLVHAETVESKYVAARPFRVNAGAVHMYLFSPEGRTRYLSELRGGDKVLAVHPDGVHRVLTVGRCKVEQRPHRLVAWQAAEGEAHAVLQTAETVRLLRRNGSLVAVTELRVGDEILVHHEREARHFGMPVHEQVDER